MPRFNSFPGRVGWRRALLASVFVGLVLTLPRVASSQLRPLVPDMLDNLSAVDRIGEAVALEDYDQIIVAARGLVMRAYRMQLLDLSALDLDPRLDPLWDAFLEAQRQAAEVIENAAREGDGRAVFEASQQLVGNSCLACHASFREPGNMLRPSVLFMTGFLASWRDINRGLVLRDFALVRSRAQEIEALTATIDSDEILEDVFDLGGSKQRRLFRGFLSSVSDNAKRIEIASGEEDVATVLDASKTMWTEGCISCHEKFRR